MTKTIVLAPLGIEPNIEHMNVANAGVASDLSSFGLDLPTC